MAIEVALMTPTVTKEKKDKLKAHKTKVSVKKLKKLKKQEILRSYTLYY